MTRTVRAAVLERAGEPLRIEELELPEPGPGQVLVRMAASGVCHSDLHQALGDWGETGPVVLGHEGSGVVEALGPGVEGLRPGQLVALNWFVACGACRPCRVGRPWACAETLVLEDRLPDGSRPFRRPDGTEVASQLGLGTFAEAAIVAAGAAVPVPEGTPPEVAALIGCGVTTGAMSVLRAGQVGPGESVVVIGLGGVGLSAVMGAVVAGASPIVGVDLAPAKLERAADFGATAAVSAEGDPAEVAARVREAVGDEPDHVVVAVGDARAVELGIELAGHGGTVLVVGIPPHGQRASFEISQLVDRSARIVGVNYGWSVPEEDFPRLAGLALEGRLPVERLIEERIGLEDVQAALDALREGSGLRRIVVFPDAHPRP
ncbi:S-(hydroxymethyl)mycothiol dehydrogenase [bacterium HR12]|nr:S-(hydroxymethyl)mycothiol dehydrogenase [bacterium HR12]